MSGTKGVRAAAKRRESDYRLLERLFFRLLPYQILLIVINAVNGIVDGLFASNAIGDKAMGAIGLFTPMTHFLYAMSIMMVSGAQLLYGIYLASKEESVQSVFSVDLAVSFVMSLMTSAVLVIGALTNVTSFMVKDGVQLTMFNRYILGQAIGIPALVLGQQLFAFLSLENETKRTMIASIVCLVSNALMDALFTVIFPMGTFGLGFASSLSEWVFFAVQLIYFISGRSQLKFSISSCNWKDAPEIMKRGYSGALSRFVEMFRCLLVNALILRFVGTSGLSAFSASNSFLGVIWALPFGMVAVERILMSISIGEEDRESLINAMRIIFRRGVPLMACVSAAIILCAHPLTLMFFRNPADEVYDMTVMGFRILPLCMPLSVISLSFGCYAQAARKKVMSVVLPVVDGFLGVSLTSLILIPMMKMNGLYVSNVLNGIICIAVIVAFSCAALKHFPRNMEELMAIPRDFGPDGDDRIDITVRKMEDVENLSVRIIDFCRMRGIDKRRTFFSSLAVEEMAGNVVEHGFTRDNRKRHSLDIRVIHKVDGVLIRFRDDCLPFDPEHVDLMLDPEDRAHNVGIRIVHRISKRFEYQNLLGCNVLTIEI